MKFKTFWLEWNDASDEEIRRFETEVDAGEDPLEKIVECLKAMYERTLPATHIKIRCTGAAPI